MSMKSIIYILMVISVFLFACSKQENRYDHSLKSDIQESIIAYINKDTCKHISYILLHRNILFNGNNIKEGYLIGPLYKDLFYGKEEINLIPVISYKQHTVYLYTELDYTLLLQTGEQQIRYCQKDSTSIFANGTGAPYVKDGTVNFLKRANLLYIKNNRCVTEQHVDTFLLPKIVKDEE